MGNTFKASLVLICILLGIFIGGSISSRDHDKKKEALNVLTQVAAETRSAKVEAASQIGKQELQNDKVTGYGIGGIVGGVTGLIAVSLTRKKS